MTVGEFQDLLLDITRLLRSLKASAAAKELDEVSGKLAAFKDYKLKAFADLLVTADEYVRLGPSVKPTKAARKVKADPAAIDQACFRLQQLHNQAIDPKTTVEAIEDAVKVVQELDPPKAKLDELARKIGLVQKFNSKDAVLKAIRQTIISIKGTWDRKDA
jgi:hypothetical protein